VSHFIKLFSVNIAKKQLLSHPYVNDKPEAKIFGCFELLNKGLLLAVLALAAVACRVKRQNRLYCLSESCTATFLCPEMICIIRVQKLTVCLKEIGNI
jgi:hypothetical protein